MKRPRLLVLALSDTGGVVPPGRGGKARRLDTETLVGSIPALAEIAKITAHSPLQLPGASLSPAHLVDVARQIEDAFSRGYDGAVVIQGSDTLEESAFILDLLVGRQMPVVVTWTSDGNAAGSESVNKLLAAARVAASPDAAGLGTLVVVDNDVHTARFVQKAGGGHPAFLSPLVGPIGAVMDDRPRFWARVPRLPVLPSYDGPPQPVALLRWGMGDDGRRLGSLPMLGFAGAVIQGMGDGHLPIEAAPAVTDLAARMPVVLTSHCTTTAVFTRGNDLAAGEPDLIRHGLIPAGCLSGLKARLLLGFALRGGAGHAAAAAAFAPYQ